MDGVARDGQLTLTLSDFVSPGAEKRMGRQRLQDIPIIVPFHRLAGLLSMG